MPSTGLVSQPVRQTGPKRILYSCSMLCSILSSSKSLPHLIQSYICCSLMLIFCFCQEREVLKCYRLVTKSCLILCDPMDYSLPGSTVHGISQARISEWVAIPSRGSKLCLLHWQVGSLLLSHRGSPLNVYDSPKKTESSISEIRSYFQFSAHESDVSSLQL